MLRPAVPYEWIQELGRPAAAIPNGRPNGPSGGSSSGGAVSAHDASPDIFSSLAGDLEFFETFSDLYDLASTRGVKMELSVLPEHELDLEQDIRQGG
jgi:hypothetical protein